MTRGKRTRHWHQQHTKDYYVRQARSQSWRSRAVYKLEEIDARDHLFKAGMTVLDLGAAPGSWSQYAAQRVGSQGRVIATDLLSMAPLENVEFVQGDFREQKILRQLLERLGAARAELVMSDMAPNITGVMAIDQPQAMDLAELSLQLAQQVLKPGGDFLVKLFQGEGFDRYVTAVRAQFGKAAVRKPAASRTHSREVYLVAKNYRL
jgi:23S rRNA (uridine2552-2'-O)-methyltransferase